MLTWGDSSSSNLATSTFITMPQVSLKTTKNIQNNLRPGGDTNLVPETKCRSTVHSLNFPPISKQHKISKVTSNKKMKENSRLSHMTAYAKNDSPRDGKPENSLSRKSKYKFNLYNLYTKTTTYERLRILGGSTSDDISGQGLRETQESLDERLQSRRHQMETREISRSDLMMSSRKTSVVGVKGIGKTLDETHLPFQDLRRRNSFIKPNRRISTVVVPQSSDSTMPESHQRKPRTFRYVGLVVRSIVGLLMRMQKFSISKTHQSAYSEFLYILAGPTTHAGQQGHDNEVQSLLFDKSWFSRTRAWSKVPTWAQTVMKQSPDERSLPDIQHLKQLLGNMRSFRENITDEMRTKLCQVVQYTRCDKGRIVFRQGHVGFDFYFIFSGSVLIQSESYNDKTGRMETIVENVLRAGESFGEIALLGDGRRTASVICKEPTELCQIDKVTFLAICPSLFNEQLLARFNFARRFDIFRSWGAEELKQLCFLSQVLDVPHSRIIEKNWATSKFVYFVMKGKASLLKEFDVTTMVKVTGQKTDLGQGSVIKSKDTCKQNVKKFALVGVLHEGDCSDLSVLAMDPRKKIAQITLVSEGVRLFRVAVWNFTRLSPRVAMDEYLKAYQPHMFPSQNELFAHYLTDLTWSEFKKNVVKVKRVEKDGGFLASIPATLKGTSGWARWPGYALVPKISKTTQSNETVGVDNLKSVNLHIDKDDGSKYKAATPSMNINVQVRRPGHPRSQKPSHYLASSVGS